MSSHGLLDKDIARFLTKLNSKKKVDVTKFPIEAIRENYERFCATNGGFLISIAKIEDKEINFGYKLPIRIYTPKLDAKLPVVIYFHGGSWSFGSLATHDIICRYLAKYSESIVIAVDWRLAPEHKYPAAIEDFLNIYNWTSKNIDSINGDINKIVFAGDSAGANVAAATIRRIKDQNLRMPYGQFLIYPALDLNYNSESTKNFAQGYLLNILNSKHFSLIYADNANITNSEISPLQADNFTNFPKTVLISAGFDPLSDDSFSYAKKLDSNGVDVIHKHYPSMIHDFLHLINIAPAVKNIIKEIAQSLKTFCL